MPKLTSIHLSQNQLGDPGLSIMASALRQLPKLKRIILDGNQVGDQGLAALLGEPMAGVFGTLMYLRLGKNNNVTDPGRAFLSATLPGGSTREVQSWPNNDRTLLFHIQPASRHRPCTDAPATRSFVFVRGTAGTSPPSCTSHITYAHRRFAV